MHLSPSAISYKHGLKKRTGFSEIAHSGPTYRQSLLGCQWILDFPSIKLLDYRDQEKALLRDGNPFGLVTLAHLQTQRTRNKSGQRYRAKYRLIRLLYGQGWEKPRIIQLLRIIDWLMALPPHLEQNLQQRLATFEEEQKMQYVTSFERLGEKKGMQKGLQQGQSGLLTRQLTHRFGSLPGEVSQRLEQASTDELETWADRVLGARTLAEVFS